MAHVETRLLGPGNAQDRVGVGLVIGAQGPHVVDGLYEFLHARVVYAGVLGIGYEKPGRAFGKRRPQGLQVGIAFGVGIRVITL